MNTNDMPTRRAIVGLVHRWGRSSVMLAVYGATTAGAAAQSESPPSCCAPVGRAQLAFVGQPEGGKAAPAAPSAQPKTEGMVWIPGGEFTMGSTDSLARPDERPLHRVRVDGFWIDLTEVTNAQFRAFTDATGYKTVA